MSARIAPTIPVVVQSDVIGSTAFSVPVTEIDSEDPTVRAFTIEVAAIEDEQDRRETAYLDSHAEPVEPKPFTVDAYPLAQVAKRLVDSGAETWDSIADRIGWWRAATDRPGGRRPDGERVRYLLGFTSKPKSDQLPHDVALDLVKGLGLDPVDVGL